MRPLPPTYQGVIDSLNTIRTMREWMETFEPERMKVSIKFLRISEAVLEQWIHTVDMGWRPEQP